MITLEIDSYVLNHIKTPIKECASLVFPHPDYDLTTPEPLPKDCIMFEDWNKSYRPI